MAIAKVHNPLTALVVQTHNGPVENTEIWIPTPMPLKETARAQTAKRIAMEIVPVVSTVIAAHAPVVLKEVARAQMAKHIAKEIVPMANTEIAAHALVLLKEMVRAQTATHIATEIVPMANTEIAAHALVLLREVALVPMVRLKAVRARTLAAPMPLPRRREPRSSRKESSAPLSKPLTADFKPS